MTKPSMRVGFTLQGALNVSWAGLVLRAITRVVGVWRKMLGHATRDAFLHLTTMYYNLEENLSGSASDCEDEFGNDNINNDDGDNKDRDDAQSNASYGENLRVRSLPFCLGVLKSNNSEGFRMTSRLPLKETSNSGEILPSAKPFRQHPSLDYTSRGSA